MPAPMAISRSPMEGAASQAAAISARRTSAAASSEATLWTSERFPTFGAFRAFLNMVMLE